MIRISVIIFRECLEIAFALGILYPLFKNIPGARRHFASGIGVGMLSALILAYLVVGQFDLLSSVDEHILKIILLILTLLMIGWTLSWLPNSTRNFQYTANTLARKISTSPNDQYLITLTIASIIFREAMEIIVYIYALAADDIAKVMGGTVLAIMVGIMIGMILSIGFLKMGKYIFKITNYCLILIAANNCAEIANLLQSGGFVEIGMTRLWDLSGFIADTSILGQILNATLGYQARPSQLEVIFYCLPILVAFLNSLKTQQQYYNFRSRI